MNRKFPNRKLLCNSAILVAVVAYTAFATGQTEKPRTDSAPSAVNESSDDSLRGVYPNLPPNQPPEAVLRGKQLFKANCSFCHGTDATGGNGGPDLLRSVLVNHDERGELIAPVIREGRVGKGMPRFSLPSSKILDLVAFLHQRNRDARLRFTYKVPNVAVGDVAAGKVYFDLHCASCHSVTGDLAGLAKKYTSDDLQQRWIDPPPVPIDVTVSLPSGQEISGKIQHIDEFNVALFDDRGTYYSFVIRSEIHVKISDPLDGHYKLLQQLSDVEMHNVTTYLESLK